MNKLSFERIENPRDIRKKLGMNQIDFWGAIGVTQSGGSRYEAGRDMPKALRELFRLVHVQQIDLSELNQLDLNVLDILKTKQPETYKKLKKIAKSKKI